MLEIGEHISRSDVDTGDGFRGNNDSPHGSWRFLDRVEDSLVKKLGVGEEERRVPTKQYQTGDATRRGIARDIVIAANTIGPAEYCEMRTPAVPQELDHSDHDRDADAGNHAEHSNAYETDN